MGLDSNSPCYSKPGGRRTYKKPVIAFLVIASLQIFSATGSEKKFPLTARGLYEACKHTIEKLEEGPESLADPKKINQCMFYVMGAADMAQTLPASEINGFYLCVPEDYMFQRVARSIIANGVQYPSLFGDNAPASSLAYFALRDAYGSKAACPQSAPPSPTGGR